MKFVKSWRRCSPENWIPNHLPAGQTQNSSHKKDQEKITRVMDGIDNTLQGRSLPLGIQEKLHLPQGAMELPGILQRSNGQFPTTSDVLRRLDLGSAEHRNSCGRTEGFLNRTDSLLHQTDSFLNQPIGIAGPSVQSSESDEEETSEATSQATTSTPTASAQPSRTSKTTTNRLISRSFREVCVRCGRRTTTR